MYLTQPLPANLETPIDELTAQNLMFRLLIGLDGLAAPQAERDQEIIKLPLAIEEFMVNEDHGLPHSRKVLARCHEIIPQCPKLMIDLEAQGFGLIEVEELLTWASVLHDLTRFLGYETTAEHQLASANLAWTSFGQGDCSEILTQKLFEIIRHHDYMCELNDGLLLPNIFKVNPLAEIFRLADKTSISPSDEIYRYYLTGKRLTSERSRKEFFKAMPWEQRMAFTKNWNERDFLTYFLILFAIQPDDFHSMEIQNIYRQWATGKPAAAKRIIELSALEGLTPIQIQEITQILINFHRLLEQPNPFKS